ncbi:MAG: hypothetical protein DMF49_03960, partial [Acidobacteria bacterium]
MSSLLRFLSSLVGEWGSKLALLAIPLLALAGCRLLTVRPSQSLLLITVDTLRADRLGCYGARLRATPRIDRLAAEGSLFEDATAVTPITLPAHASIMTGRYPAAHGVLDNAWYALPEQETTLAEILKEHGYRTGAFVGSFVVATRFGLGQGFETFDEAFTSSGSLGKAGGEGVERGAEDVDRAVLPWLRRAAGTGAPFFLWVHYYDPHFPYEPPPKYAQLYAEEPYSGEVAAVDEAVGRLLDALEESGAAG